MSLLLNMLSRLVIIFLPRSKCLLISWLQSPSAVILEPQKIKPATISPSISHEVMGPDAMILVSECSALSQLFHSPLSLSSRDSLVLLHFLPILRRSAFFIVQLSHPYMTTGRTIALTRRTFVGKVISLLLNMLSRLVITFHSRSLLLPGRER